MQKYPSIKNLFKRDNKTHKLTEGEFSYDEFHYLQDCPWDFYEKIDGTNIRIMWDGYELTIGGRTDKAQMHDGLLAHLHDRFNPDIMSAAFPTLELGTVACIYGEGFGIGIQKGGAYCRDGESQKFAAFDIKIGHWWLTQPAVHDICSHLYCDTAPWVGEGDLSNALAYGCRPFLSCYGEEDARPIAEGIVCRPQVDLFRRNGERVIVKIKHKDFE